MFEAAAKLSGALCSYAQNYLLCVQSISYPAPMSPFCILCAGVGLGVHTLAIATLQSYLKIPEM